MGEHFKARPIKTHRQFNYSNCHFQQILSHDFLFSLSFTTDVSVSVGLCSCILPVQPSSFPTFSENARAASGQSHTSSSHHPVNLSRQSRSISFTSLMRPAPSCFSSAPSSARRPPGQ